MPACSTLCVSRVVLVTLEANDTGSVCRLRWWQPNHSGEGLDVWAIDDILVTEAVFNTIWINFTESETVHGSLDVHLGKIAQHCGREHALVYAAFPF